LNGIRKVRLKSASRGKSGGFRICYYYLVLNDEIFLLYIYAKNNKEDLNSRDKTTLKEYVRFLKGVTYE